MIIARCLMCEATMTNDTGLNSIISWVVDLNDIKSPFHSESYERVQIIVEASQWYLICVYIKVVISTSQLLHISDFMTFPFVTSYFGRVTLESTCLNNRINRNFMHIHIIFINQSLLSHPLSPQSLFLACACSMC